MPEPTPAPTAEPTAEAPKPTPPTEAAPEKDETDWKAEARKWETRAKENKTAADKLTAIEEAQKTEAQRLEERATAAEKALSDKTLEAERALVALEKGLTPSQAKRLIGSTREELSADADEIVAEFVTTSKPGQVRADPSQGPKAADAPTDPAQAFALALNTARGR